MRSYLQQIYYLQLPINIQQNYQECQYQCTQYCQICKLGLCYKCQPSYYLIDQQCNSVCGDGLVAYGQEQCDDMNDIQYDGCYECQFQCKLNCEQCVEGICQNQCKYGYHLINEQCYSICGDEILSDVEDCDDNNDIKGDGCYQCQYSCPINCDTCENGKCLECQKGYNLNQGNCQSICGDGQTVNQEQCDDSNQQNGDGCSSQCQIENNYICLIQMYSYTQCIFEDQPQLILNYFEEKQDKQYVSLKFSQKVKSNNIINYQANIQTSITNVNDIYYTIQIIAIQEAKMEVSDVEYLIEISFNQEIDTYPELEIILLKPVYNEYNLDLLNYEQRILLRMPRYIDSFLQQSSDALTKINKVTTNSLGFIALIVIIFRNSIIFSDIINLLQQQSYLRFVNIKWPFNLEQYFQSILADVIQVFLNHLKIWGIFLLGYYENFAESYQKFKFYDINADFLTNIESQLFQVLLLLLLYMFSKSILFSIKLINDNQFKFIGLKVTLFLLFSQKWCQSTLKGYSMQMVTTFIKVNSFDLFFTCFLSLTIEQNYLTIILPVGTLFSFVLYFFSLSVTFTKQNKILAQKNNHELIAYIKKLLFIIILVYLQSSQVLQTILLGMLTTVYLLYLYFYQIEEKHELLNIYILEINTLFFLVTSVLYWDDFEEYISYDKQVKIAWCQIGFMLFTNLVNLIKYLKIILTKLLEKINFKWSKVIEKNKQMITFVTFQKG